MRDPANFSVIETLRDGREIEIRAQRPQDRSDLEAAIVRMSDESLYRRFFGARRHFSEAEARYFLNIDLVTHAALVALAHEPGVAEVAFGVIDEYQGQGIGAALMRNLSSLARQAGVTKLIAEVLASNGAMLKVFERSGMQMKTTRDGNVFHLTLTYD